MAIRKFRKKMKPIIWGVTILFLGSLAIGLIDGLKSNSNQGQYAFEVEGNEVTGIEIQRTLNVLSNNYSRYLQNEIDSETLNILGVNEVLNKKVAMELADDLKVKVSNSEVDKQVDAIKANFANSDEFKKAIFSQGYTTATLKKQIKEDMILQKLGEEFSNSQNITEEEIQAYYDQNKYGAYAGKTLDEVKEDIESMLKRTKGNLELLAGLNKKKQEVEIDNISDEYGNYIEKEVLSVSGKSVSNLEFSKELMNELVRSKDDIETAKEKVRETITEKAGVLKEAEANGIQVNEYLPFDIRVNEAIRLMFEKLRREVSYTDAELENYFNKNVENYNIKKSADANIIVYNIVESESDDKAAEQKAKDLLLKVTPENFAEMAKEHSDGPTGPNGGALGTFEKGSMVKPFEDAAFSGEVGKVYPVPVKTQFGYHLIYVQNKSENGESVTASHILIDVAPSEETLKTAKEKVTKVVTELKDGTLTLEKLKENKEFTVLENVENIVENGFIPRIGYNAELSNAILNAKLNEYVEIDGADKITVFDKISQVDARDVTFDEVKEKVIFDYKNSEAKKAYETFEKEAITKIKN